MHKMGLILKQLQKNGINCFLLLKYTAWQCSIIYFSLKHTIGKSDFYFFFFFDFSATTTTTAAGAAVEKKNNNMRNL